MNSPRLFDLNVEEVLDHWELEHAIREVVANALDEQLLSGTQEIEIYEDGAGWHIRDYGRGLEIEHLTLNENPEKLGGASGVIGRFGVGLKDALATFHRRGAEVTIESRHGVFRLREAAKHSFEGITTLHVEHLPGDPSFEGTDVCLQGVTRVDIERAKSLFMCFNRDTVIERTRYGEVLVRAGESARVYINGVLMSEEPGFLFSYNITSLTDSMRKQLNRERLNIGRATYAERVKSILRTAESEEVCEALADQVARRAIGNQAEEMQWIEIAHRANNLLHERRNVAFISEEQMGQFPDVVDNMKRDGLGVVIVPEAQEARLEAQRESGDGGLRTLHGYVDRYRQSFEYVFVAREQLSASERTVFEQTKGLLALIGLDSASAPPVLVSETMRATLDDTSGAWDAEREAIVIKRTQLRSLAEYGGTLLHEVAHAVTGTVDATRDFESVLTAYLGQVAAAALGD